MGFLKKLLAGADKVDDAKTTFETELFKDRRFERAEKLAATGDANTAVITGIKRRYNDSLTDTDLRLEWFAPEPRVGGIHYGADIPLVFRLGSTIAVKSDADSVVVDPAAMAGVPGAPSDAGRGSRKAPDQGVDDKALDMRVLTRLDKWTPKDATVESFERVSVLGMPAENWHIQVTCADGTRATVNKDYVPPYARWYVAPGAVVPVVTDPKDPAKAQVNWPLLAERAAVEGGSWQDDLPAGSIAESLLRPAPGSAAEPVSQTGGVPLNLSPSEESAAAIEGITIERCAYIEAALVQGRVPPAEYDAYAVQFGVPPGRWASIKSEWEKRLRTDWRVGAAFGEAFEAAQKELKKKR
jgi:hypothetical protein